MAVFRVLSSRRWQLIQSKAKTKKSDERSIKAELRKKLDELLEGGGAEVSAATLAIRALHESMIRRKRIKY